MNNIFTNKLNIFSLSLLLFITISGYSQELKMNNDSDLEYEIKHKSEPWFSNMKDGANYFEIKKNFDKYFANHSWEKSKPRSLGEDWLKTKLFYLDENGFVQPEPEVDFTNTYNSPLNTIGTASSTTIGTWTLLGPVNSATSNYSGPGNHGGYVFLNRIDPTNNQKFFVAFVTGGLWMTADSGTTWTLVDSNLPDDVYSDLDVCISNPQTVYAIGHHHVIKSVDGGLNWLATNLTSANHSGAAYDIAVSTSNPNIVVARWGNKVYRTTNGGTSWSPVLSNLPNHSTWDCSITSEMLDWSTTNANVVYALATSNSNNVKVYRSANAGASFSLIKTITLASTAVGQTVGWAKLLLPASNSTAIYVAIGSGNTAYAHHAAHLYKLNATTGNILSSRINMIGASQDLHHGDIAMDRNNENNIIYGDYGVNKNYYSSDNGATFNIATSVTHSDIRTIDFVNAKAIIGSDGESIITTDMGATNITVTNPISNHELWGFGSAFKTDLVASGNNHGPVMVKESHNGFDWYNGPGADQGNTDVNPLDDRYIYSQGYSNYRFFRTGVHAIVNQSNYLDLGGIYSYFNSIEFHPNKYYTIITHHAGQYPTGNPNLNLWKKSLIKTEDNGNSISIVKTFTKQVFREKISMKHPGHIYVVAGLSNNQLWHSADSGATWVDITPSLTASSGKKNISDIAVGDENPNQVWVTYGGVQTACKVLKSNNYGASWQNITQSVLTNYPITKIIFQRGSNGGVYVGSRAGVFYRNNTMANWQQLGNGLPMCDVRFMFINYNQNKLKIGTSRGAFTNNLYEISPPNALISCNSNKINCPVAEPVHFKDYSVIRNSSATWLWSFPGGTPSTSTLENPVVSYAGVANGSYDVSLTITDAYGTSSQTLSNFIQINNICGTTDIDSVPGNIATIEKANNQYLSIDNLSIPKNSFTFSCWIKPNGIQEDYSCILTDISPNSTNTFALNFLGGNNTIGYHPDYWWNSGLQTPPGEWSHIVFVYSNSDAKVYVNGEESSRTVSYTSDTITNLEIGRYGHGYTNRYANFEIDEVCIWNRTLSKDEIRAYRHLIKSDYNAPIFNGLVGYYQFNELVGNISLNKVPNTSAISLSYQSNNITHNPSTAPVFVGVSEKKTINSSGIKDFSTTGLALNFANGIYPDGDVWVSKSTINPDILPNTYPDTLNNFNTYYVINNYGTNKNFTPLQSITFSNDTNYADTTAGKYRLYQRGSNAFGNTWGALVDSGDIVTGTANIDIAIEFSNGLNVDSFSQFVLLNKYCNSLPDPTSISMIINKNDEPNIFPNPMSKGNVLNIELTQYWQTAMLIVYDSKGQSVAQTSLNEGDNQVILNLSAGVYFAVIINAKNKFVKKIVIFDK